MSNSVSSSASLPVASVVVAVYNAEKFIAETIQSVLRQSLRELELILVNDGSTDGSLRILEALASTDRRCRVHDGPNRGAAAARNTGFELARSEYVAILDADDLCRPTRLEKQVSYLRDNPACVAVGSRVLFIDDTGLPLFETEGHFTHEDIQTALLARRLGMVHPSMMVRRSAWAKTGGYRDGYFPSEDLDFFLRLAEIGQLANIPEVLLEYRQHMASGSYKQTVRQAELARKAILEACERRGLSKDIIEKDLAPLPRMETRTQLHRKWAWSALNGRNVRTARKHALRGLLRNPASIEGWRVAWCALRGY